MLVLYYEECWAILSTIGIANVLYGLVIISITKPTSLLLVPIIVSAAGAVANGLCYYAFYAGYPTMNAAVASGFADFFWLVQEVGMSFYSYIILTRLLTRRSRLIFTCLFWAFVVAICVLRVFILIGRIKIIISPRSDTLQVVNYLHTGYFSLIALLECTSAFFLLREYAAARRVAKDACLVGSLLQHLMRGTETRVASLALIGLSRSIAYIFNQALPEAVTTAGQVDRFIYTLECMFPIMIYIDILACKLKFNDQSPIPPTHFDILPTGQRIWAGLQDPSHHLQKKRHSDVSDERFLVEGPRAAGVIPTAAAGAQTGFTMYDDTSSICDPSQIARAL